MAEIETASDEMSQVLEHRSDDTNLEDWYAEYMTQSVHGIPPDSKVVEAVQNDDLNYDTLEKSIYEKMSQICVSNGFCTACQNLFDHWPDLADPAASKIQPETDLNMNFEIGWKHTSERPFRTDELEASTRKGCKLCTYMLQVLTDDDLLHTFRRIEARMDLLGKGGLCSLSIQNWGVGTTQLLWLNFPNSQSTHCNDPAAVGQFQSDLLPSTANLYEEPQDVHDLTKFWLDTCIEGHELCRTMASKGLPTRLVSVGHDTIRLVLTSGLTKTTQYSTLSHAWGSKPFLKLTSDNFQSLMREIPYNELSKTFQDAVEVTRKLGLEFLWIDALCIIQGDDEDWEKESSLMSIVYGRSAINIAATSAIDGSQGCFLKPPYFSGGLLSRITVNGVSAVRNFYSRTVRDDSTISSYLAKRAWTLQETILAPRSIYLGNRGAFWACQTTSASEFVPEGFKVSLAESGPLCRRGMALRHFWPAIVRLYSEANLTFERDKLPALSGIAHEVYRESPDGYLAGMWRKDIEDHICWRTMTIARKRPRYRSPTWSWASVDGPVLLKYPHDRSFLEKHAHVIDVGIKLSGQDPFGQVQSGTLRIACSRMGAGRLVGPKMNLELGSMEVGRWLEPKADFETGPTLYNLEMITNTPVGQGQLLEVQLDCSDGIPDENETVYLLPVMGGYSGGQMRLPESITSQVAILGILLQPSGIGLGEYRRLGSFRFYGEERVPVEFENKDTSPPESSKNQRGKYYAFRQHLEEIGEITAEAACAEIIENTRYTKERYIIRVI